MNRYGDQRRLPNGIQSFEKIRKEGYVYVDKTDMIWELAHGSMFNYLSRPRRFGKSVLVDTLACYFEGKKELFEGLRIMELEREWARHPVIRLDMSCGGASAETLRSYLDNAFYDYEEEYSIKVREGSSLAVRFANIIRRAAKSTGQQSVILIDEYDSPLQHSWHTPEHEACTAIYREVFAVLKTETINERFVFITGITKFTQISLFSVLNNLTNVSFMPQFATICGITGQEIKDNFMPEIERMAARTGNSAEEALQSLKNMYDGYHFSADNMADVYNPFSLVRALADGRLGNYWASSGATSLLPKFVDNMEIRIRDYDNTYVSMATLETSDVTGGAELFLYQSGYLTIKAADADSYTLGIPNQEVRQALYEVVVPALTMRKENEAQSAQASLFNYLKQGRVDDALLTLKALVADVPYSNKKLSSIDMEERYRFIISSVFHAIGMKTEVEHMMAKGRIDILTSNATYIYVIELKLQKNGGLAAAEQQIRDNIYDHPFQADGRTVIPLAIELDDMGKGILGWKSLSSPTPSPSPTQGRG